MTDHKPLTTFDKVVYGAIAANIAIVVWGLFDTIHIGVIEVLDQGILWFFVLELVVRLRRMRGRLLIDRADTAWLAFDSVVIGLALSPLGGGVAALRVLRGARLTHFGRHLSHLRLFSWLLRVRRRAVAAA